MLYLDDRRLRELDWSWEELEHCIADTVRLLDTGDCVQPLKPYLRMGNPVNRIIAMPAYVGGEAGTAGLKWIASFPGNVEYGKPRAHSILLLNDAQTGIPYAIINSPLPSAARTAAVSAVMLRQHLQACGPARRIRLGIIGFGPIGQHHYDMCGKLFGDRIDEALLYDARGGEWTASLLASLTAGKGATPTGLLARTRVAAAWHELYNRCNVIITCTVSERRYIDRPPQPGSLLLDVSLRDYQLPALQNVTAIVVDDWNEVCRENTDIELLHRARGLEQDGTLSLADVVCRGALSAIPPEEPVLFCPMGMAAFDISTASLWVRKARLSGIGLDLTAVGGDEYKDKNEGERQVHAHDGT